MTIAWQGDELERRRRSNPEPQILPPEEVDFRSGDFRSDDNSYRIDPAAAVQNQPVQSSRSRILIGWSYAPATYVLVGINVAVYGCMVLGGVSPWAPTAQQILHWGANRGANEILQGEWWRLVSATFVHVGIIHLATNMWCLWNLGLLGEPLMGAFGILGVYALTGVAGNLLSSAVNPAIVGAGASGAVFGIAGILIMLLNSPHLPFPRQELRRLRRSVIYFAVVNLAIGASTLLYSGGIKIDNMAHLGGVLSGLALGVPLAPVLGTGKARYQSRQKLAFSVLAGGLLLFGYGMVRFWKS